MNKSSFHIERTTPQPGIRPVRDFSLSRERRNKQIAR
jgi:hypothetical protein